MLSVRLNYDVERQLDFLSMTSGLSKNQLVTAAIDLYLKQQSLGTVPLAEQVQEASYETFMHARKSEEEEAKNAVLTANWARSGGIWSGVVTSDGGSHGAIYGRNQVVGYAWSDDSEVMVISRHLPAVPYVGADAYSYNVTAFDVWKTQMRHIPLA
jgi:hypothetical protein